MLIIKQTRKRVQNGLGSKAAKLSSSGIFWSIAISSSFKDTYASIPLPDLVSMRMSIVVSPISSLPALPIDAQMGFPHQKSALLIPLLRRLNTAKHSTSRLPLSSCSNSFKYFIRFFYPNEIVRRYIERKIINLYNIYCNMYKEKTKEKLYIMQKFVQK